MTSLVAAETLSTGFCPHNCTYCYIPKTDYMKQIHKDLIICLENGTYIELLKKVYGENLEYLGLWGTEPTLTLPLVADLLPILLNTFPKLEEISFSTAMMADPSIIVNFAKALAATGTKLTLSVQMSLDGPEWITNVNRYPGAAALMPKNFFEIVKQLNECNLKQLLVKFKWKATHSLETMVKFIDKPEKVYEYIGFFEGLHQHFNIINKNKNITLMKVSYLPTLVVPGKYTSEDGKTFTRYLTTLHNANLETVYVSRLNNLFENEEHLDARHQSSCSGGDSNLGIAPDRIHICHRTFYLDDERYIQAIIGEGSSIGDAENWDMSHFRKGIIDFIRDNYIVPVEDLTRFRYVLRGYHDFWRLQLSHIRAMLIELALANQVDSIYLHDENLSILFSIFISSGLSCPMENLLNTGSIHLQPVSLIRLFANGAFQEIVKEMRKRQ